MVSVGFTYLPNVERGKLDFGNSPSASLIQRLASALDANEEDLLLLSHKIPASISKRIFEQPETFRELARCDSCQSVETTAPHTRFPSDQLC